LSPWKGTPSSVKVTIMGELLVISDRGMSEV
jgi:hypothetical protein